MILFVYQIVFGVQHLKVSLSAEQLKCITNLKIHFCGNLNKNLFLVTFEWQQLREFVPDFIDLAWAIYVRKGSDKTFG